MNEITLVIENVGKAYSKNNIVLDNVNLNYSKGVLGLLGPNGSGKSTLMRIIATITKASSGTVRWKGEDIIKKPNAIRSRLGYLPQNFGVYPNLNAYEFLEYIAALKGISKKHIKPRVKELVEAVNLTDSAYRSLGNYSGGMKQRVGIAMSLLNDPEILIVDEPTVGLDPAERVHFRNILSDLASNKIIILSTHIISDVEAIATNIAFLQKGRLSALHTPEEIITQAKNKVWTGVIPSNKLQTIREKYTISSMGRQEDGIKIRIVSDDEPEDVNVEVAVANLEDAYLYQLSQERK